MSYCTQWNLYGKDAQGHSIPCASTEVLRDRLEELADEYYEAECLGVAGGGELICALMTDYHSAHQEVVEAVTDFSASLPDAVFCLDCDNTDTDDHQRIHIRGGEREELDGHIAYEPPKKIPYESDSGDAQAWQSYCQYLRDWADSHCGSGFEGCCPACYDEFLDGDWPALHDIGTEPAPTELDASGTPEVIEFYWKDLTSEKQAELLDAFGNNLNWDTIPFFTFPISDN